MKSGGAIRFGSNTKSGGGGGQFASGLIRKVGGGGGGRGCLAQRKYFIVNYKWLQC